MLEKFLEGFKTTVSKCTAISKYTAISKCTAFSKRTVVSKCTENSFRQLMQKKIRAVKYL